MSVYKRGSKWCFDFWVGGKRYRGSIPEARVKAQAERAENAIRDQVYEGRYGKKQAAAPLLRDFVTTNERGEKMSTDPKAYWLSLGSIG